jgi:hypothetical protein
MDALNTQINSSALIYYSKYFPGHINRLRNSNPGRWGEIRGKSGNGAITQRKRHGARIGPAGGACLAAFQDRDFTNSKPVINNIFTPF